MKEVERQFSNWSNAKACMELLDAVGTQYTYHVENSYYYVKISHLNAIEVQFTEM